MVYHSINKQIRFKGYYVMKKEELYDIAKDAVNSVELSSNEIPPIDLYVDQILNLVNDKLSQGSERYLDKQLTKTMINNYSKDGLITPVKGKKYNKEQILQMLTVYTLKGTLTINEIKRLINGAYTSEGFNSSSLNELYDKHLEIKKDNREFAIAALDGLLNRNELNVESDIDYICLICALTSFSAHLRNIAQAMIDVRFPELSEEDDDKKDKEKDKEKDKDESKESKKDKKERKEEEKREKEERKANKKQQKEEKKAKPEDSSSPDLVPST